MKKISINIFFILPVFIISGSFANAEQAVQSLVVDIPSVNNVTASGGNLTTTVDPSTGNLSSELNPVFTVSTNNNKGLTADFNVKVDTISGIYNGSRGMASDSNTGICVMTNSDFKPDAISVNNSLDNNASPSGNPNATGYQISFENQDGNDPVYDSVNSTVASGKVLRKKGNASILVRINNNSSINSKTYSNMTDTAGSYQLTVYCTVYNP